MYRNPSHSQVYAPPRVDTRPLLRKVYALMTLGLEAGYAALAWEDCPPGGHAAHAAMVYLTSQVEPGVCCPMTMSYAAVPALRADPALAVSRVSSRIRSRISCAIRVAEPIPRMSSVTSR